VAGSGFIVADESEELGDAWWVADVLRVGAGESRGSVVVFCRLMSRLDLRGKHELYAYHHDELPKLGTNQIRQKCLQCCQKSVRLSKALPKKLL
jgi:hypothetical protein